MPECLYFDSCPILKRFQSAGARSFWETMYCRGSKQHLCERKRIRDTGGRPAETLLPNGTHLASLAEE